MLTRREMNTQLVSTAALFGMAGIVSSCAEDDDDDVDVEKNALELQQKEGWNVGSTDKTLTFTDRQANDSKGSPDWKKYTQPDALMKAYQPADAWKPYFTPTLIQGLSQESLRNAAQPVFSNAMREAYSRGLGMKELLKESKNPQQTLLLVDIPGPEAVAFAAAVADVVQPVITFDNLPHPLGVVPSHQTLGAMLYYAQEITEKATKRPTTAPALIVLDSNRLNKYTDADNQFDNRYMAKLPTADNLKSLNIGNLLYGVPSEAQKTELDDLNDDFATFQEKSIAVSMLPLTRFQPQTAATSQTAQAAITAQPLTDSAKRLTTAQNLQPQNGQPQQGQPQNSQQGQYQQGQQQQYANGGGYAPAPVYYPQPVYYYGGNPFVSMWFFHHYASYSYYRPLPAMTRLPASSFSAPAYQAVRRPTVFSASSVGGNRSSGVGKSRPTGFGFVGVRMNSSRGTMSGVRAGRSGSFGRSSSFGGRSS